MNAEEQYIIQAVSRIMSTVDWHTSDWLRDGAQVEWEEIEQVLFYEIREAYLIGRVSKSLEIAVATEEAPQ